MTSLSELAQAYGFAFKWSHRGEWLAVNVRNGVTYGVGLSRKSALEQALCRNITTKEVANA